MDRKVIFLIFVLICQVKFLIAGPIEDHVSLGKFQNKDIEDTYRLPNDSIPLKYDLWLETDVGTPDEKFNFSGKVKITIEIINATDVITLHFRKIKIIQIDQLDATNLVTKLGENLTYSIDLQK
jgi:hypothetical protein